jgi:acyl carrier protein
MQIDSVKECIRGFLASQFPLARNLSDQDTLLGDGIVDSLGILEIVSFLEREFGITVVDEELLPENFNSISELAVFVHGKLNSTLPVQ